MLSSPQLIHLYLQPEIEAHLAAEAESRGLALNGYIEKIVEIRSPDQIAQQAGTCSISEAVTRILGSRKGTSLGELKIKDLLKEGRKH